jgi:molybdenum cofactor cytidylyltransferase
VELHSQPQLALAGIVLAAGLSRRMGAFKPLLPFGNQTVIEHTIRYLRGAGVQRIVVVIGHHADELRRALENEQILFAVNPQPESVMSESIKCGVAATPADSEAFVMTPVDHAAVPSDVVKELIEHWRAGARLVIPTWQERGGHPVLVDSSFRSELLKMKPDDSLRSFFSSHQSEAKRVPVSSSYVVRDMDTWDDYVGLHNDFFGSPPKEREDNSESQSNQTD